MEIGENRKAKKERKQKRKKKERERKRKRTRGEDDARGIEEDRRKRDEGEKFV